MSSFPAPAFTRSGTIRRPGRGTCLAAAVLLASACGPEEPSEGASERVHEGTPAAVDGAYDVRPGQSIQAALERAAVDPSVNTVRVHAGTYRPGQPQQALVWLNARHDGLQLEAVGEVILSARHEELSDARQTGSPALVNHVLYIGDGVGPTTRVRGFHLTGANGFATSEGPEIEPASTPRRDLFHAFSGGGLKVFGRAAPVLENLVLEDNFSTPSGAGASVQQASGFEGEVVFRGCVFRNNRSQVTGAALELLPGSRVRLERCLFTGNVSNTGIDHVTMVSGQPIGSGHRDSGVVMVFPRARLHMESCTITGNRNGVEDHGEGSSYRRCLFWQNQGDGGLHPASGFDLKVPPGAQVFDSVFTGATVTPADLLSRDGCRVAAEPPDFDAAWQPRAASWDGVGYRRGSEDRPGAARPGPKGSH